MGFLDDLFGDSNTNMLSEKDIASDMLKDSKFGVMSLAMAVTEAYNPEARQFLKQQLKSAIQSHYKLSDLAVQKSWYQPHLSPVEQLSHDARLAQQTINNQ